MTRATISFFRQRVRWHCSCRELALLWAGPSQAGIESCGNIDNETNAMCEVQAEGGCEASCEGDGFQLSCDAERCTPVAKPAIAISRLPDCEVDCQGSCEADCDVNPNRFDCEGSCQGSCEAGATDSARRRRTRASAKRSCRRPAQVSAVAAVKARPPRRTAKPSAKAAARGQCDGRANFECQSRLPRHGPSRLPKPTCG